ncbi:MAG: murein biosynthesis integral membrane protein MurJ [Nitrospirae bacterium]|nr:murein biosynthesis integral membrane protein MurJ [Nitrospirota bacterium]
MSENKKIAKAATIISLATLASRLLGLVREMIYTHYLGAGRMSDAFFAAYRIPNLLRDLFAEGSMSAAFIPVFTDYLTNRTGADARKLVKAVFTLLAILLVVICTFGIIIAPFIVRIVAPGFYETPEKFSTTVLLTRIMFPFLLFIGLSALAMGILNSLRSFASPALSPVMFNIMIISSAIFISPFFKEPAIAISLGVLLGGLFQLLFQMPTLKRKGMMFGLRFAPSDDGVKRIGNLLFPAMLGQSVALINLFITTILASFLADGSISYLAYSRELVNFPLGVFAIALSTAILPSMAEQAARHNYEGLRDSLSFGLRLIFFITIPSMVGLILLRIPIISLIFQHGKFEYIATIGTADALIYFTIGLWAFAGVRIVVSAFYSLNDTKTPMKIGAISLGVNIVLSIILMFPLKHKGLAFATSIASIVNFSLLLYLLRKNLGYVGGRRILKSLVRTISASLIIAGISWYVAGMGIWAAKGYTMDKILILGGTIIFCTFLYGLMHIIIKSEEIHFFIDILKERFRL